MSDIQEKEERPMNACQRLETTEESHDGLKLTNSSVDNLWWQCHEEINSLGEAVGKGELGHG